MMKPFLLIALAVLSLEATVRAAGASKSSLVQDSNQWTASFGFWNWTEKMTLSQGLSSQQDWANLQANSISVGVRGTRDHWGYDIEALFLSGKASGGGANSLSYQQGNLNFNGYGGKAGVFYRPERFIELGVSVPALFRNLSWPTAGSDVDIKSGSNPLITGLFFWRIRPAKEFLIEQGFGPAGIPSQSIWNLQAQFLF